MRICPKLAQFSPICLLFSNQFHIFFYICYNVILNQPPSRRSSGKWRKWKNGGKMGEMGGGMGGNGGE